MSDSAFGDLSTSTEGILAVNIGSSSIKFSTHLIVAQTSAGENGKRVTASVFGGSIQGLEPGGTPVIRWSENGVPREEALSETLDAFQAAIGFLKSLFQRALSNLHLRAVVHRVVHGGDTFTSSIQITPAIMQKLKALEPLAPLHQPHNLHGIEAFARIFPEITQIACFDTVFHTSLSALEKTFPLNQAIAKKGIHRYGFHGLSYEYISTRLAERSQAARGRLLMAHLGNGASLCASISGKSFATTMGFSAAGGLMMGTRCGDIDPGVLLHLIQEGFDAQAIENLIYRDSGLRGVSGLSADMRALRADPSATAQFAVALFEHRIIREAGGLIATMGGLSAIAFAGGIGEHDFQLREKVCNALSFLGVEIDAEKNRGHSKEIIALHRDNSPVEVWLVPTDEGIIAAEHALMLLGK